MAEGKVVMDSVAQNGVRGEGKIPTFYQIMLFVNQYRDRIYLSNILF